MWLTIGYFTPRPVLFSLALLAIFLLAADDGRLRWALPIVIWIWAGVHGGFIVGLGYLVLDGFRRRDGNRIIDFGFCGLATLLTAHGWGSWEVVLDFLGNSDALDLIFEWLTPNFISIELFPFALAIVAMFVGAINGGVRASDLWVIAPFLLFAFTANRAVPIAGLVLAPFFVGQLQVWRRRETVPTNRLSLMNTIVMGAVLLVPWLVPLEGGLDDSMFAVSALRFAGPERLFHDDAIGGYLIYDEWPDRRVYIDDRAELYGDQFVRFVEARAGKPGWQNVFDELGIRQALLKVEDPLGQLLQNSGWRERYRDGDFVLLAAA
jgi:hypothetical protein